MVRVALLAVAVFACGGDKDGAPAGDDKTPAKESEARKSLVEAWQKAGLEPSELKASTTGGTSTIGKDCKAGTVNNVDVVICDLGSADEAKKAEAKGLEWVGGTTGAAWVSGPLVIAVADRKKADANGRTINRLMKSTPK